jgi:AraC-like DNA-binding protein
MPRTLRPSATNGDHARYYIAGEGVELLEAEFDRHVYERHVHESYAIGVTLRGVQRFWCRGATRDSRRGDVMLIGPGEVHDGQSGAPGGYAYHMLYVPRHRVERVIRGASGRTGTGIDARIPVSADAALSRTVDVVWRAARRTPRTLAAEQLLDEALLTLAVRNGFGAVRDVSSIDPHAVRRVRDYLHTHFEVAGVAELATIASMSRFQLTRQFQRFFGLPLHAYHLHVRLEEARRRLSSGEAIASVASRLGFADQSHLNRRFKGAFGVTPGDWRRLHRTPRGIR